MIGQSLSPKQLADEAQRAYTRGENMSAGRNYEAAAEGYQSLDDPITAAEMRNNSCVAYIQSGDGDSALRVVEGTAEVFANIGDIRRQGMALGNLGSALEAVGRLNEAIDVYQQSASLLEQAGETKLRANVMQSISALQLKTGHQLEALATMQAGLESIEKPNPRQRMLKKLLQMPYKLLGGS